MFPYIRITLPSYSVMALLGGFAAVCFIFFRLDRFQIPFTSFLEILLLSVVGGYIGSKLLYALTQLPWLVKNFSLKNLLLLIPQSGLVFYGGLFGVIFTLMLLTRKDANLRARVFRMATPAMPLFHTFGRVGCFMTGCCYGKELIKPITVGVLTFTRFPVQLVEALAEVLLFLLLLILDRKSKDADLLKTYLILYAVVRFADEFLRGDEIRGIYFGLSTAQWISLVIILVLIIKRIRERKEPIKAS